MPESTSADTELIAKQAAKLHGYDDFADDEANSYFTIENEKCIANEAALSDSFEYNISDIISPISEPENDLNEYAATFFKTIQNEYHSYVSQIENILEKASKDLPPLKEKETLKDY